MDIAVSSPTGGAADRSARDPNSRLAEIVDCSPIRLGYLMAYMTNHYLGPVYKAVEARYGLTSPEFLCLLCSARVPGINAIDISRSTGRPRNSISRAITQLLEKKLLTVEIDAGDRRRKRLVATAEGMNRFAEIEQIFRKRHEKMLAVVTREERRQLEALLGQLAFRDDGWAAPY